MPQRLLGPTVVSRPRLVARLSDAAHSVAVVSAPAGYGKSVAVAEWTRTAGLPVAWLDLEVADNDPTVLLERLLDALAEVTDLCPKAQAVLRSAGSQNAALVEQRFGMAVRNCGVPYVLVLDDVHHLESRTALDLLSALVSHAQPGSKVVLAGRGVHVPALSGLRVATGLVELSEADLALTPDEVQAVVARMGVEIDRSLSRQLADTTEGWPVGVRLAAIELLEAGPESCAVSSGPLDHRLAEYVHSEWLRGLGEADAHFLLRASILETLYGPLCDHVLDIQGSGAVLEALYDNRKLVIPLDRRHDSYRMHRVLREALRGELERAHPAEARRVHARAAEWMEARGDAEGAIRHALASGDHALAERLVTQFAPEYQTRGRGLTIVRWLQQFPAAHLHASPGLCLVGCIAAVGHDSAAAIAWAAVCQKIVDQRGAEVAPAVVAQLAAIQALLNTGLVSPAREMAAEARERLAPGVWHTAATQVQGAHEFALGKLHDADSLLAESASEAAIFAATTMEVTSMALRAAVAASLGEMQRANDLARAARHLQHENGLEGWPTVALATALSALTHARNGRRDRAGDDIDLTRHSLDAICGISSWVHVPARLALIETFLLLGEWASADLCSKEASQLLAAQPDAVEWHRQLEVLVRRVTAAKGALVVGPAALSAAEMRVLVFLPTNLTIEEIGERLYVSRHTAKSHVAAIYRKLGTTRRQETVELARAMGLLPADEVAASRG